MELNSDKQEIATECNIECNRELRNEQKSTLNGDIERKHWETTVSDVMAGRANGNRSSPASGHI